LLRFWLDSRIKLQTIRISVPFCENAWHSISQPECRFDQGCNEDSNAEDNELSENEAWSLAGANFDDCAPRAYWNANEVLSADCALARRRAGVFSGAASALMFFASHTPQSLTACQFAANHISFHAFAKIKRHKKWKTAFEHSLWSLENFNLIHGLNSHWFLFPRPQFQVQIVVHALPTQLTVQNRTCALADAIGTATPANTAKARINLRIIKVSEPNWACYDVHHIEHDRRAMFHK
jgi:hypothetical protein